MVKKSKMSRQKALKRSFYYYIKYVILDLKAAISLFVFISKKPT